ncbi:hypothetical protein ACFX14_004698 [Malus domestica]|uniref:uncharacterized protein n=1 Tax=Malus domestica TaxID=3750 RepID=UPI0039764DF4
MWTRDKNFRTRGFSTPPATWKTAPPTPPAVPMSEGKRMSPSNRDDLFHVVHKVPAGDSPYVRAKQVQLIDKDPGKAISLFWAAINAGDRVDSALKDMAVVMKQLDRAEEAIEAIKSFRHLCPYDSQESLNNVLVELYKRSGRIEEEIELLESKLKHIDEGVAFCGRRTKTARAQGRKVQITVEQERARILGNLAWAYLQKGDYKTAEEYYLKALSLEPDKNKQCNLAICLMHMNRFTEAKHLLQVVRDSSGNKLMDESYAKSFERAYQMLTELEAQSVLRPIQQDGRSYMFSRRRADGREEENLSVDQWKKDRYFKNLCESRSSFSSRMKDNQGDIVGAGTTPNAKTYFSPGPAIWDPEVQFSQPRRSPWGFNGGHPRRELSFVRCPKTENVRAHAVRNLNEDLPSSTVGKSEFPVHNSVSSLSSPISRDLRRPQGGAAVRSVLQPISSGNWKGTSRGSDGCFQLKDKATVVGSSQNTVNGDWRKGSWENGGIKKSAEPQMAGENAKALDIVIDGGQNQSSDTTVLGSMEPIVVEGCFRENSSGEIYEVQQPVAENQKQGPHLSMYSCGKKSWADMAEEEEQELFNGSTEYFDFNNENLNCNIPSEIPCLQTQVKSLGSKLESVDLKDKNVISGNAGSPRNSAVRRSLRFDQQQDRESVDYISSSSSVPKAGRRKRLQSFQDITEFQDSP